MAKKRKKSTTRRRRSVGAIGGDGVKLIAGAIAGALVGRMAANKITSLNPKIMGGLQILGGGFLAVKSKNPLLKGMGIGLAATGAISEAQNFGLIAGIGAAPIVFTNRLNGSSNVPRVGATFSANGFPKPNTVGAASRKYRQNVYGGGM